jgi:hypothetical protein
MRRGKSQVLYRYLPGMFPDFNRGRCITIVSKWDSREIADLSKKRILKKICRNFPRFKNNVGFPNQDDADSFEILSPRAIEVEVFPLTLVCSRCERAVQYRNVKQLELKVKKSSDPYKCPNSKCTGKMMQKDLVYVHSCGFYDGLNIAPCKQHGYEHIKFNRKGSKSPADWMWTCVKCNTDTSSMNQWCNQCKKIMYPKPVGASAVFYPHSETIVNLHRLANKKYFGNEDFYKLIIARHIGLIGKEIDIEELLEEKKGTINEDKMNKFLEELKEKGMSEEDLNMARGVYTNHHPSSTDVKEDAVSKLNGLVDSKNIEEIALDILEYTEALNTKSKMSVQELLEKAKKENHPNLYTIKTFPDQLKKIGVKEACVLGDLSILNLVYGYTRGSIETKDCTLRSFPEDKGAEGKTPVYANQNDTEGIVLEFDRLKIIRWLKENGIIDKIPAKDEASLKAWFLNNINLDSIETFNEIPDEDKITKAVFGLLHSMAHALLIKASVQCGLEKDSLGELIFPEVPAIVIYSTNSRFQLGGMFTLFESKIYPWIDRTIEKVETCVYDPLCIGSDGACHACLFTSEISCIHFNRDLSRSFLVGRDDPDGKRNIVGFWSKDFIKKQEDANE